MDLSRTPIEVVESVYKTLTENIATLRERKGTPLTLAEKILFGHAKDPSSISLEKGEDYGDFAPDRVAMQDATAQMALLQFMQAGMDKTAVPSTVHCDHLIQAYEGASSDLAVANKTHKFCLETLKISKLLLRNTQKVTITNFIFNTIRIRRTQIVISDCKR